MEAKELIKKQKTTAILRIVGWSAILVLFLIDLSSEQLHKAFCWIFIAISVMVIIFSILSLRKAKKDLASLDDSSAS